MSRKTIFPCRNSYGLMMGMNTTHAEYREECNTPTRAWLARDTQSKADCHNFKPKHVPNQRSIYLWRHDCYSTRPTIGSRDDNYEACTRGVTWALEPHACTQFQMSKQLSMPSPGLGAHHFQWLELHDLVQEHCQQSQACRFAILHHDTVTWQWSLALCQQRLPWWWLILASCWCWL